MAVSYEWDIETIEPIGEDPEILDHDHRDELSDFPLEKLKAWLSGDPTLRLVLVRDADNRNRGWAYVTGGLLPNNFTDANGEIVAVVPRRFHVSLSTVLLEAHTKTVG